MSRIFQFSIVFSNRRTNERTTKIPTVVVVSRNTNERKRRRTRRVVVVVVVHSFEKTKWIFFNFSIGCEMHAVDRVPRTSSRDGHRIGASVESHRGKEIRDGRTDGRAFARRHRCRTSLGNNRGSVCGGPRTSVSWRQFECGVFIDRSIE